MKLKRYSQTQTSPQTRRERFSTEDSDTGSGFDKSS